MRKVLNWVWSFVEVIIIIYVVLVTMFVLCKNKYGYTQFGDYSFANIDLISSISNACGIGSYSLTVRRSLKSPILIRVFIKYMGG